MHFLHKQVRSRQRGAALLELALATPLFITVIYGIFSISLLMRAQYQVSLVAHAVMREAAGGETNPSLLSSMARAYAGVIGMNEKTVLTVDTEAVQAGNASGLKGMDAMFGTGVRINIMGIVPVGGMLRRVWPEGVSFRCSMVCLPDPWKSPFAFLNAFIVIPEML